MARGKSITISDSRHILYYELLGLTNAEIASKLELNHQTIDRAKQRDDYLSMRKFLAEHLMQISTSELMREI